MFVFWHLFDQAAYLLVHLVRVFMCVLTGRHSFFPTTFCTLWESIMRKKNVFPILALEAGPLAELGGCVSVSGWLVLDQKRNTSTNLE